jgi:hypothetical protein
MTADTSAAVRRVSEAPAARAAGSARESSPQAPVRARRAGGSPQAPSRAGATTYSRSRRSPARATALIVGAVVIGVAAVVLVVSSLGGSSGKGAATTSAATTTAHARAHHGHTSTSATTHPSETSAPVVNPAEAQVAVLNGTGTPNLAHRLSASLQQSGYSQATPLSGTPPGSHQATVVEYSSGHRAEAAQVAQALGVSQVRPLEAAVSPLAGSSTVVVIAGLDKAGAGGEASPSSGGEASPGGGAVP